MKLWSGRFEKQQDKLTDSFNSSLPFDIRLYKEDIEGSIAHADMLAYCGIITDDEARSIAAGLKRIRADIESGALLPKGQEDVHMFVESRLTELIGDAGKKLHTARSRNDQVATDFKLYIKKSSARAQSLLGGLVLALCDIAADNTSTVMPGYTHLQSAQPVTLAHHLMAYCEMFLRDVERFKSSALRGDTMPLGSCALAGTTYPIDRFYTTKLLSFSRPCANSLDGVSDRDFAAEYLFNLSMTAMHLSRFCEELVLWSSPQFGFAVMDDAFSIGSSIMPQKKNPDVAELIRGKTGRVYGNLMALLTTLKSLPLAYNKDMQEDKEAVFDSEDTVFACLTIFTEMIKTVKFNRKEMRKSAAKGFFNATDVADYLVKKGMPFRDAHHAAGNIVLHCEKNGKVIEKLTLQEFKSFSPLFEADILNAVKLDNVVKNRKSYGGPAPSVVKKHIRTVIAAVKDILQTV